jgi:hypothetical protein
MHSGEIAEWVAAIAEACSVIVALFLPYYNQHVENKRKLRNLKVLIRRMTQRALNGDANALTNLRTILTTAYLKNMNAKMEDVISDGEQILELLVAAHGNFTTQQKAEVKSIMRRIEKK